jgi:uncharacterized radical SAM superfamily Fe-S cluster-containing enzyme
MKFELTDNELQMYNAKVKVWQDKLYEYIRDNFVSELYVKFNDCVNKANLNTFRLEEVRWDAPQLIENYAKSNCIMKILKDFKEKHPFPKLVEL